MSTVIRPDISKRNKYWISKDRYYELKHFCLQYKEWKQIVNKIRDTKFLKSINSPYVRGTGINDPTSRIAITLSDLTARIRLVEDCANEADSVLAPYIFKAVTEGLSFTYLKSVMDIPCERDMYYDRYRKFFWLLSAHR